MSNIISSIINGLSTIILSLLIANYGVEKFYYFIKKEALTAASRGLPSMSKMTNQLTCKQFNAKMELVPYTKGSCAKKGKENARR
tara:strand:- start:3461 stop:3715 length:255 start_codon:yes stop_codon:yes gene_type:complete